MIRTHMIRAETSSPMSKDQYRHEANAFWELKHTIKYLSDTKDFKGDEMTGHTLNKYGKEVIQRLKELTKKILKKRKKTLLKAEVAKIAEFCE